MYAPSIMRFLVSKNYWQIVDHMPWLNTAVFWIGENDLDQQGDDKCYYKDLALTFMHIGKTLG